MEESKKKECKQAIRPIRDTLYVLQGKWKLPIIVSLSFGAKRFKDMEEDVSGITPRMLSKELKELEVNGLVKRTVYDSKPVLIEYSLTPYGDTLKPVIKALKKWGTQHRKRIMAEKRDSSS